MSDKFQPLHLLQFRGDPELEFFYRALVPNLNQHDNSVNSGLGYCLACNAQLTVGARPRLKPPQKLTPAIQRLMFRTEKKLPVNKFGKSKLKKFFNGSQCMVIKCLECLYVNHIPMLTRENLVKLKQAKICKVEEAEKDILEPSVPESSKKKKRKKKKKIKRVRSNPNSLLYDDELKKENEEDDSAADAFTPSNSVPNVSGRQNSSKMTLSQFVTSQTKDNSSTAVFQRAIGAPKTSTPQTIIQPAVAAGKKPSASSSRGVGKKKTILMHKQLKKFLAGKPAEPEATASLKDFLTLLG